ncbi:MAG: trimethylamine methyltransferase family protein [Victivallales bacterium]|nr:trimethylamine methyltransferase family protein [Victivallales bacterium]
MITSNQMFYRTPQFQIFSESEREMIYSAALEVLETAGVQIERKSALTLLENAGARIEGNKAYIPSYIVEEAVRNAPRKILIYDRNGNPAMRLESTHYYFGTGSDTPHFLDSYNNEIRRTVHKDIGNVAKLVDALPNLDFLMSLGLIWDEKVSMTDLYQFQEMLFNTTKPIVFTAHDLKGTKDIIKMASIAAGSEDELKKHPFIINYIEPTSPLVETKEPIDKLLYCAEQGIPSLYTPTISAGSTAPATLAGTIIQALAECLSGVTMAQLNKKGAPVLIGGVISAMDMHSGSFIYGGPDFHLMCAGMNEMSSYLGLPVYGTAGCTDSKAIDEQAAIEGVFSINLQALSGGNLIHDVGYIASGLIGSLDMVTMCDEIIAMTKRIMRGIEVDKEHLAVETIRRVGPKGSFIADKHTMRHFKDQQWYPELMDRKNYDKWAAAGKKSCGQRINEKVKRILKEHKPEPLEKSKQDEIMKLINSEAKTRKVRY